MIQRTALAVASASILAATLFTPVVTAASATTKGPEVLAKSYSSCAELTKDYKHGISDKKDKPKSWWVSRGATAKGNYRPAIYANVHRNLDRDGDHIACER